MFCQFAQLGFRTKCAILRKAAILSQFSQICDLCQKVVILKRFYDKKLAVYTKILQYCERQYWNCKFHDFTRKICAQVSKICNISKFAILECKHAINQIPNFMTWGFNSRLKNCNLAKVSILITKSYDFCRVIVKFWQKNKCLQQNIAKVNMFPI